MIRRFLRWLIPDPRTTCDSGRATLADQHAELEELREVVAIWEERRRIEAELEQRDAEEDHDGDR